MLDWIGKDNFLILKHIEGPSERTFIWRGIEDDKT